MAIKNIGSQKRGKTEIFQECALVQSETTSVCLTVEQFSVCIVYDWSKQKTKTISKFISTVHGFPPTIYHGQSVIPLPPHIFIILAQEYS